MGQIIGYHHGPFRADRRSFPRNIRVLASRPFPHPLRSSRGDCYYPPPFPRWWNGVERYLEDAVSEKPSSCSKPYFLIHVTASRSEGRPSSLLLSSLSCELRPWESLGAAAQDSRSTSAEGSNERENERGNCELNNRQSGRTSLVRNSGIRNLRTAMEESRVQ